MKSHLVTTGSADTASTQPWVEKQIQIALEKPLDVRFYGRRPTSGKVPLVLHFHGGAFVGGSLDSGSCVARLLADAGAVVMSIDYPLASTQPFPSAVETGYAALVWAFKARQKLAGAGAPVFVAGEEAGGNLAAAISLMARDRQTPALAGQILLSPMLDPCVGTASLRDAQAGPVGCPWADGWHQYLAQAGDCGHPYAAPGTASRLADLPPTLLVTAQDDPLRDETLAYAGRLRAAGREVQTEVLTPPTGWPCSYLDPASVEASWSPIVRQAFAAFLARTMASIELGSITPAI